MGNLMQTIHVKDVFNFEQHMYNGMLLKLHKQISHGQFVVTVYQ